MVGGGGLVGVDVDRGLERFAGAAGGLAEEGDSGPAGFVVGGGVAEEGGEGALDADDLGGGDAGDGDLDVGGGAGADGAGVDRERVAGEGEAELGRVAALGDQVVDLAGGAGGGAAGGLAVFAPLAEDEVADEGVVGAGGVAVAVEAGGVEDEGGERAAGGGAGVAEQARRQVDDDFLEVLDRLVGADGLGAFAVDGAGGVEVGAERGGVGAGGGGGASGAAAKAPRSAISKGWG